MRNRTFVPFFYCLLILFSFSQNCDAGERSFFIVAQDGTGDYKTISEAIKNLPMFNYERVIIFIKNGNYVEKIRIEQDYITIRGEDKEKTIIRYNQLREDWIKTPDAVGPAVINIHADDIIIENLTVENTQPEIGPHAFAIYGTGTRTILLNCRLISKGGDTVSLWNYKTGMYYHSRCYFEGAVDFVCPRGWCYINDSKFYEVKKTASIWHAGSFDINQKLVIKNSTFDGVIGYELGRHHYDAQFILVNCKFSENLADKQIYRVTYEDSTKNRSYNWGIRNYFYNCHKEKGDYTWLTDNLEAGQNSFQAVEITPLWTFGGKWDPESNKKPEIISCKIENNFVLLSFNEPITIMNNPVIRSKNGTIFKFYSGGESNIIKLIADKKVSPKELEGLEIINNGRLIGTIATVKERSADLSIK